MLGVMMLISFAVPLAAALMIRRYTWAGICAGLMALVAIPVIHKLATNSYDAMGWGFVMILVFMPAAAGTVLGGLITAFRRWKSGPGPVQLLNIGFATLLAGLSVWFGLWAASDF
ncbi:MAG: hypothetical protein AAGL11_02440 [Pseudomonadota bacterium]